MEKKLDGIINITTSKINGIMTVSNKMKILFLTIISILNAVIIINILTIDKSTYIINFLHHKGDLNKGNLCSISCLGVDMSNIELFNEKDNNCLENCADNAYENYLKKNNYSNTYSGVLFIIASCLIVGLFFSSKLKKYISKSNSDSKPISKTTCSAKEDENEILSNEAENEKENAKELYDKLIE